MNIVNRSSLIILPVVLAISITSTNALSYGFDENFCKSVNGKSELNFVGREGEVAQCYEMGAGVKQNYEKAAELYKIAGTNGDVFAQNSLGHLYELGAGVERNEQKAFEWYLKAANQNYIGAAYDVAQYYQNGIGIPQNSNQAIAWYLKVGALDQNFDAGYYIGLIYALGIGIKNDPVKADEWFEKTFIISAGQDFTMNTKLGLMYQKGFGVKKDSAKAVKHYLKAAESGYGLAQSYLGIMYESGDGIPKDDVKAAQWFKKNNELKFNSSTEGYLHLARQYEEGRGVSKDTNKAIELYEFVAPSGAGIEQAQFRLGEIYESGLGVKKNIAKAIEWYVKASTGKHQYLYVDSGMGSVRAQYKLGQIFENGVGVAKNDETAVSYYQQAAAQGNAKAQERIGILTLKNAKTEPDLVCSFAWLRLAERQLWTEEMSSTLSFLTNILGGSKINQASSLASNWKYGDKFLDVSNENNAIQQVTGSACQEINED